MAIGLLAAGAGLSALGQLGSAYMQGQALDRQSAANLEGIQLGIDERRQGFEDIKPYWEPSLAYGEAGRGRLSDLGGMVDAGSFDQDLGQFAYGRNVQDFLDPSMAYEQAQMADAVQSSAAAQGGLLSGEAVATLQDRSSNIARGGYGAAQGAMERDKQFGYTQYLDHITNTRASNNERFNKLASIASGMTNIGTGAASQLTGARTGLAQGVSDLRLQQGQAEGARAAGPYMAGASALNTITDPDITMPIAKYAGSFGGGNVDASSQLGAPPMGQFAAPSPGQMPSDYSMQMPYAQNLSPQLPQLATGGM